MTDTRIECTSNLSELRLEFGDSVESVKCSGLNFDRNGTIGMDEFGELGNEFRLVEKQLRLRRGLCRRVSENGNGE